MIPRKAKRDASEPEMATVALPWPSRDLHPNSRVHWSRRSRAAKVARQSARYAALAAGIRPLSAEGLDITAVFQPPDNRRRDLDGMLSNCKSYLDGIADVAGVDDSKWAITMRKDEPVPGGRVVFMVDISKGTAA